MPNDLPYRLAGRGVAAMLLLRELVRAMPVTERRPVVRRALAALEANGLAARSKAAADEARRALVSLLPR